MPIDIEKETVDLSGFKKIHKEEAEPEKEPEEVKGAPMKDYPLVEIEEIYKLGSKELVAVFEDVKAPQTDYYTIDQWREVISQYIDKNELNHPKKRNNAFLDPYLSKLVKNESDIKPDPKTGKTIVNKGALFKDIELFLRPYHIIKRLKVVAKDVEKIKAGYIPKVQIIIEKHMNKNVTRVVGLQTWEVDLKDACQVFKNQLAVGVSIWAAEGSTAAFKIGKFHYDY